MALAGMQSFCQLQAAETSGAGVARDAVSGAALTRQHGGPSRWRPWCLVARGVPSTRTNEAMEQQRPNGAGADSLAAWGRVLFVVCTSRQTFLLAQVKRRPKDACAVRFEALWWRSLRSDALRQVGSACQPHEHAFCVRCGHVRGKKAGAHGNAVCLRAVDSTRVEPRVVVHRVLLAGAGLGWVAASPIRRT